MRMLEIIKQAGVGAVEAGNPVAVEIAKVTKINPLEVSIDQRLNLPEDFLVVPEHLTEYKLTIGGTSYSIRRGLEVGDALLLLRVQGGQQYVILDRVVL